MVKLDNYREDEKIAGFGIGMHIVKSIIDASGIVLSIDSTLGEGSRLCYHFPSQLLLLK